MIKLTTRMCRASPLISQGRAALEISPVRCGAAHRPHAGAMSTSGQTLENSQNAATKSHFVSRVKRLPGRQTHCTSHSVIVISDPN